MCTTLRISFLHATLFGLIARLTCRLRISKWTNCNHSYYDKGRQRTVERYYAKIAKLRASGENAYGEHFLDGRIIDIFHDMTSSSFLDATLRMIYISCIQTDGITWSYKYGLSLFTSHGRDATASKNLGITRLGDPSSYKTSEEDTLLMIQAA